jgi:hypothetical protein
MAPPVNNGTVGTTGAAPAAAPAYDQTAAARELIGRARANIGWHEGPNNDNPYTQRVMGSRNQPWCAAYVSCMLKDAKPPIPGISGRMWSAGVSGLMSQFQRDGRLFRSGSSVQPQPGDVIFFGSHHTGIVEKVANGKVYTVEGNTSDRVLERSYPLNSPSISGYGRVFGGKVPPDVGFQPSEAYQDSGEGRATGRGSYNTAQADGVAPSERFNNNQNWIIALLRAMAGDDPSNVAAALSQMFPQVSNEDLADVAKVLKDNPQLANLIAARPDMLQQLVMDHSPKAVKRLLKEKLTEEDQKAAAEVMQQVKSAPAPGGWSTSGPTQFAAAQPWGTGNERGSNGPAWQPPKTEVG